MGNTNSSGVESQSAVGTIYLLTCTVTGKKYVGQTRQKLEARIRSHKSSKVKRGVDVAIQEYGLENFTVEVLETCPVDKLNEREKFWIRELNTRTPNGYNLTDGGNRDSSASEETRARISANHADFSGEKNGFYGKHHSEEAKRKMSLAKKGKSHKPHSPETRKKISESNKGKQVSQETRDKISASEKGKQISQETRDKMSEAHKGKGRPHTSETKAKISAAMTGKPSPRKGVKLSPETRQKLSEALKAAWARRKKALENGGGK